MHLVWRVVWGLGSIVCTSSLIVTYIYLASQTRNQFYTWASLQVIWLLLRSTYFHLAKRKDEALPHLMLPQNAACHGQQLLRLCAGISQYQIATHLRGQHCYLDDARDANAVAGVLKTTQWIADTASKSSAASPPHNSQIEIVAVIGDTFLSSVSWIREHNLGGFDLYDSCLVAVKTTPTDKKGGGGGGERTILVPGARVLSGKARQARSVVDMENGIDSTFRAANMAQRQIG